MTRSATVTGCLLIVCLLSTPFTFAASKSSRRRPRVRHIIFMMPDGMGLGDLTAARIWKNGTGGPPFSLETLPRIGYRRTYSADSAVTDSAAAASAMACGEKFANGEICLHADGRPNKPSILEIVKAKGWATGLVVTSAVTDASPASFAAHVRSRGCEKEIARQYFEQTRPNVILGGGMAVLGDNEKDKCGNAGDVLARARTSGYMVVTSSRELENALSNKPRYLLGLFAAKNLPAESQRTAAASEPRLSEMTRAALRLLENNPNGFFLFVEGSLIDLANHHHDLASQSAEVAAFDEAVKVVLDWIEADHRRRKNTLLVVAPDHDTGGLAIEAGDTPGAIKPEWTTTGHTGTDVPTWSAGPGSESLGRAIDNTQVYIVMKDLVATRVSARRTSRSQESRR